MAQTEEAATAWVRGDLDRYLELTPHAPGFTLLAPFGGHPTRHQDRHKELASLESSFHEGAPRLEHVEPTAWATRW